MTNNGAIRLTDNSFIPNEPANIDWQAYLEWEAAGNTPQPSMMLGQARAAQTASIYASYASAIAQNVAYTSKGGISQTFQADPGSIANVERMLNTYSGTGQTPLGFYWIAADKTKVPFAFADLQGLAAVMGKGLGGFPEIAGQQVADQRHQYQQPGGSASNRRRTVHHLELIT